MSSPPTFLALPFKIRLNIYLFADLVRVCPINLNNENSRKAHREELIERYQQNTLSWYRLDMERARDINCNYRKKKFSLGHRYGMMSMKECICPPIPIPLFTVCRAIYEEVLDVLYAENKFKLHLHRNMELDPKAISRMKSLCIRLNMCSCVPNHICNYPQSDVTSERCEVCHSTCRRGSDTPLSIKSADGADIVEQWVSICRFLAISVRPTMRLAVICDCADMETARKISEPLGFLPKLAECTIRLGQSPSMPWRTIAESTVRQLVDRPQQGPFSFLDLPLELRRHILSYTDLVSPYILEGNGTIWPSTRQRGIRPFEQYDRICCLRCSDAADACCCAVNHAAFSSTQCHCWSFPAALFSVSQEMKKEATVMFFSRNRFLVKEAVWLNGEKPGLRRGLEFLRSLPHFGLKNLRWIRFTFPSGDQRLEVFEGSGSLMSWKETAQFIERNMDTALLTIELDLQFGRRQSDRYDVEDVVERESNWTSYQNMAEVFHFKDGLKDFFVHLASPYDLSQDGEVDNSLVRKERASILEKRIMGENYDSGARGKYSNRGVSLSDEVYRQLHGSLPKMSL